MPRLENALLGTGPYNFQPPCATVDSFTYTQTVDSISCQEPTTWRAAVRSARNERAFSITNSTQSTACTLISNAACSDNKFYAMQVDLTAKYRHVFTTKDSRARGASQVRDVVIDHR